jgi:uncharacterized membrane protein YccC
MPTMLPSTRLAIQAGASALAAVIFVNLVSIERPYWVILTAVVVMVGTAGETLTKSIDRTLGTLFGLIAGIAVYWVTGLAHLPVVVLLLFTAPSVVFFRFANYRLMVTAITASVVWLLELGGATQSLLFVRLFDTAIGAVIGVTTSFLILRLPTRRPVLETIEAYKSTLAAMIHGSLQAVIDGRWSGAIDSKANQLRGLDADFDRLVESLRAESAFIGGGDVARAAVTILPVLRGHVEMILQAAQAATASGLGKGIAAELQEVDRQIAANLDAVHSALETGRSQEIPTLDRYYEAIEERLLPKLKEGQEVRRDVVAILNVMLALRRLNRSLRNAMTYLKT